MENTFFKNLLEQFPYISLVLVISVGLIYLIKLILNLQKDYSKTNLNDEIRQLLLSERKNKKLVDSLTKLQISLYESDESLKSILLKSNYVEIDKLGMLIDSYINKLPKDWKFMKSVVLEKESINNLKNIKSQAILVKNNNTSFLDTNNYRNKINEILSEIEKLLDIILEHNKKINSNISFFERYKGLGLLSILVIFIMFDFLLTIKDTNTEKKYIAIISEHNKSINKIKKELDIACSARIEAEKKLKAYKEDRNNTSSKKIKIKIEWNSKDDLDLSVRLPNLNIIDYHDLNNSLFQTTLKADIQRGPATEEISIKKPLKGSYKICISNYPQKNLVKFNIYQYLEEKIFWHKKINTNKKEKCFTFTVDKNSSNDIEISKFL